MDTNISKNKNYITNPSQLMRKLIDRQCDYIVRPSEVIKSRSITKSTNSKITNKNFEGTKQ